jgi:cilia- and flagella-associated protein 57
VRIWNWQDMSLELVKQFQDEAYSIAIHPNGLLVVAGFANKLRLLVVLLDDLKVIILTPFLSCQPAHRRVSL